MVKKDVLFNVKELYQLIGKIMFNNVDKPNYKPTVAQIRFIDYLVKHSNSDVYQKDLEKEFHISRATVSDVLNTMEKHKIITRVVADNDTRTKKIILNEEFRRYHKEFKNEIHKMNEIITKNITADELKLFNEILDKMKKNVYEFCDLEERNDDK